MLRGLVKLIRYMDGLSGPAAISAIDQLLREANVKREDMVVACKFSEQHYARNILAKSPWYQLIVICWRQGQASPIHDHAGSACGVRVVDGVASETCFAPLPDGYLRIREEREFHSGEVCTTSDTGIHVITNRQPNQDLVTLHLYSPPLRMNFYDATRVVPLEDRSGCKVASPGGDKNEPGMPNVSEL
jgi:cysteine dioxygenase